MTELQPAAAVSSPASSTPRTESRAATVLLLELDALSRELKGEHDKILRLRAENRALRAEAAKRESFQSAASFKSGSRGRPSTGMAGEPPGPLTRYPLPRFGSHQQQSDNEDDRQQVAPAVSAFQHAAPLSVDADRVTQLLADKVHLLEKHLTIERKKNRALQSFLEHGREHEEERGSGPNPLKSAAPRKENPLFSMESNDLSTADATLTEGSTFHSGARNLLSAQRTEMWKNTFSKKEPSSPVQDPASSAALQADDDNALRATIVTQQQKILQLEQALQHLNLLKCELTTNYEVAGQSAEAERQQLDAQLQRLTTTNAQLENEVTDLRAQVATSESLATAKSDQCSILQSRMELMAKKLNNASIESDRYKSRLDADMKILRNEVARTRATAEAAEEARAVAQDRLSTMEASVKQLFEELEGSRESEARLQKAYETLSKETDTEYTEKLKKDLLFAKSAHADLNQRITRLQSELEGAVRAKRDTEQALADAERRIAGLQSELMTSQARLAAQEASAAQSSQTRVEVQRLSCELELLRVKNHQSQVCNETLSEQLENAKASRDASAPRIAALEDELEKMRGKLATTAHRLEQYRKAFQPMQETCNRLKMQLKQQSAISSTPAVHSAPSVLDNKLHCEAAAAGTSASFDASTTSDSAAAGTAANLRLSSTLSTSRRWLTPLPIASRPNAPSNPFNRNSGDSGG